MIQHCHPVAQVLSFNQIVGTQKDSVPFLPAQSQDQLVNPASGDFSFRLQPLPKVWLEFICYLSDEDFPASVTCLYSQNADRFLTTDALADVGEYTVKKIITML